MESLTSLDICHPTKLVDKICRCRPMGTLVHEDCIFKCNPLRFGDDVVWDGLHVFFFISSYFIYYSSYIYSSILTLCVHSISLTG